MADIPVVEERIEIGKHRRVAGRVRVVKSTRTVPERVQAELASERVEVRRVPADRFIDAPEAERREGDRLIIPVMAEVLVVEKRLKVVEEIHLIRRRETRTEEKKVVVRKEIAKVERR